MKSTKNQIANSIADDEARGIRFSEDKCILLKYNPALPDESYVIPPGITGIGDNAFACCANLTSVKIPLGVTVIGKFDFACCHQLKRINIPDSVTGIGDGAFAGCVNWKSVRLPSGVKNIGNSVFAHCCLIRADIPEGVISIGDYAFANNSRLTSVILPNSLKTIGYRAFSNDEDSHRILKTVVIPAGVEEIGSGAFSHINRWHYSSMVDDLNDIHCHVVTPIDCYNIVNKEFEKTLHVPAQSVVLYRNHSYWAKFKEIVPLTNEETGISPTTMREPDDGIHYSLSGSRISPNGKGIHLVRYDDGTVRKVICK